MPEEQLLRARDQLLRTMVKTVDLLPAERLALSELPLKVKIFDAHASITRDGAQSAFCCLVIDGLLHRYKDVPSGRRQVLSYHVPGDIPDLINIHLGRVDHSLGAVTATQVALIPHKSLHELTARHPGLATAFWRETQIDAARSRAWTVNLGARNAASRIGHLICELFERLRFLNLNVGDGFTLPLTQADIGDATGMSTVHVNRTLQELRGARLIASEGRLLRILDWERLKRMSDFDPAYLHLERRTFNRTSELEPV